MKRIIYISAIVLLLIVTFLGCNNTIVNPINNTPEPKKEICLDIMTSNKLVYYMVKSITKDKHIVDFMFKSEKNQWEYKFSTDSLDNISKKDLFIYTGVDFEPWMGDFVGSLVKNSVGVINVSRGTKIIPYSQEVKYNDRVLKDNPYYWLNPDNYKIMMLNIKNSIEEKDPKNRQFYEDNFSASLKEVDKCVKDFKDLNDQHKDYTFITIGDSMDYFTKYYGLKVIKLDDNIISNMANGSDKDNNEKKIADAKKVVLLYDNDSELLSLNSLIKKYNIKAVNIISYGENLSYNEMLNKNLESLKAALN